MKNEKLTEIFLYVCFIGRLIRQFFVCPDWVIEMQEQEANIFTDSPDTRTEKRLIRNRMRRVRLRREISPELVTIRALKKIDNELVIILKADEFKHLIRFNYRFNWLYLKMKRSIAARTHSSFKRWNDNVSNQLTLLFGLSNIRPANLYDAIFGSSSFRIH